MCSGARLPLRESGLRYIVTVEAERPSYLDERRKLCSSRLIVLMTRLSRNCRSPSAFLSFSFGFSPRPLQVSFLPEGRYLRPYTATCRETERKRSDCRVQLRSIEDSCVVDMGLGAEKYYLDIFIFLLLFIYIVCTYLFKHGD